MPHARSWSTLLISMMLVAAACTDDQSGDADGSQTGEADSSQSGDAETSATSVVSTEGPTATTPDETFEASVTMTPSPVSPIAATVTIESSEAVTARITATTEDHEVVTPLTATSSTMHVLPLVGMRQDRTYDIVVDLAGGEGAELDQLVETFTTGIIDDDIPEFDITLADPERRSPGITIVETNTVRAAMPSGFGGNAIVGLDEDDQIVWYYNTDRFNGAVQRTPAGEVAAQNDPFGMTVHAITGEEIRRHFADATGDAVESIENGVEFIPFHADWVELGPVHHDLQWLEDGTAIAISRTVHEIPVEQQQELCPGDEFEWGVTSDVIVQFEVDGTVLRTWDLWDISSFDDIPGNFLCQTTGLGVTETERDWTHANSVWFDESRDAILVSSRHTDQIIALAMTEEIGPQTDVRWILGRDGTIPYTGDSFHHTHGVKTTANGDVLAYDNGNFRPGTQSAGGDAPSYSRAVRIEVDDTADDPSTWTATQIWEHRMIDPLTDAPLYAPFISDADELANGNILVTHGGAAIDPADFLNSHVHIVEIAPSDSDDPTGGVIVWELRSASERGESTYRADRWESLYFGPLWADS